MIIRDSKEEELDFIREMRLQAYEEHAPKIPEAHWSTLKQCSQKRLSPTSGAIPGMPSCEK